MTGQFAHEPPSVVSTVRVVTIALVLGLAPGCRGNDPTGSATEMTTAGTTVDVETGPPTTGGTPGGGHCGKSCSVPSDCCPMGALDCPGDAYPNNWGCDVVCIGPRCSTDDECISVMAQPDAKCLTIDGSRVCRESCAADGDCTDPEACTGFDDFGTRYCSERPGEFLGCPWDVDCTGHGVCNTQTGKCECSVDAECTKFVDKCVL